MSTIIFKITNPADGTTRRLPFTTTPTWAELASKLKTLYGIGKDNVCVSYTDVDGDQVTLSTSEELDEHLKSNEIHVGTDREGNAVKLVRFTVHDLSALRSGGMESSVRVDEDVASSVTAESDSGFVNVSREEAEGRVGMEEEQAGHATAERTIEVEVEPAASFEGPTRADIIECILHHHVRRGRHGSRGGMHHGGHPDPRAHIHLPPSPPSLGPSDIPFPPHHGHAHMSRGGRGGSHSFGRGEGRGGLRGFGGFGRGGGHRFGGRGRGCSPHHRHTHPYFGPMGPHVAPPHMSPPPFAAFAARGVFGYAA